MPWLSTGRSMRLQPVIGVSAPTGYSWQVALQQRLLPLHQPRSFCYEWERRASEIRRTANCGLTGCLSPGVHRNPQYQGLRRQ